MEKTKLPLPQQGNLLFTRALISELERVEIPVTDLVLIIQDHWKQQPDRDLEGGNDKEFYTFGVFTSKTKESIKVWVKYDPPYSPETHETDHSKGHTYTAMLPEDY